MKWKREKNCKTHRKLLHVNATLPTCWDNLWSLDTRHTLQWVPSTASNNYQYERGLAILVKSRIPHKKLSNILVWMQFVSSGFGDSLKIEFEFYFHDYGNYGNPVKNNSYPKPVTSMDISWDCFSTNKLTFLYLPLDSHGPCPQPCLVIDFFPQMFILSHPCTLVSVRKCDSTHCLSLAHWM